MHYVIVFESDHFDLAGEEPNPINPIQGQSVGLWMASLLESEGLEPTDLDVEDWGWYLDARFEGRDYLVGFVAHPAEETGGAPELIVQVDKYRSLREKLTGKEKMDTSNGLLTLIAGWVRSLDDARNIEIQRVA